MRVFTKLFLLVLLSLLLAACGGQPAATDPDDDTIENEINQPEGEEGEEGEDAEGDSSLPTNQTVANLTLYDSFADWCATCRVNKPIIDSVRTRYDGQINVVTLNVDSPQDTALREQFGLMDRSMYVLVDGKGEVLMRWFGFLNEDTLSTDLEKFVNG